MALLDIFTDEQMARYAREDRVRICLGIDSWQRPGTHKDEADAVKEFQALSDEDRSFLDEWLEDHECWCELISSSARTYTHHISTAISLCRDMPAFRHLDEYDWLSITHSDCACYQPGWGDQYVKHARRFVSVDSLIRYLSVKHGMFCTCCERIIHAEKFGWTWQDYSICNVCAKTADILGDKGLRYLSDDSAAQLVSDYRAHLRGEASEDRVASYVSSLVWLLAAGLTYKDIARIKKIDERRARSLATALRAVCRKPNPKHISALKQTHQNWKVAYDAVSELGIKI